MSTLKLGSRLNIDGNLSAKLIEEITSELRFNCVITYLGMKDGVVSAEIELFGGDNKRFIRGSLSLSGTDLSVKVLKNDVAQLGLSSEV